ncbi:unnamed protein product, partial [Discosporangium mesarthrocarpum]
GVGLEQRTSTGCTALYMAVVGSQTECVGLLIDAGADINAPDRNQRSPLYRAATAGNVPMCVLLVQRGADIRRQANDG